MIVTLRPPISASDLSFLITCNCVSAVSLKCLRCPSEAADKWLINHFRRDEFFVYSEISTFPLFGGEHFNEHREFVDLVSRRVVFLIVNDFVAANILPVHCKSKFTVRESILE